jgi:hypothetical protein
MRLGEGRPVLEMIISKGNISLKIFKMRFFVGERNEPHIGILQNDKG